MEFLRRIQATLAAFFGGLRTRFRSHATVYGIGLFVIALVLIIWARFGFTLDISRFYAYGTCNNAGDLVCVGNKVNLIEQNPDTGGCIKTLQEDCGTTATCTGAPNAYCKPNATATPAPAPAPTATTAPAPAPTSTATAAPTATTGPGVQVAITNGGLIKHEERVNVMWSALWADSCTATNWIDTGGKTEGSAQTDPINACAATLTHTISIKCCDNVLGCGTGSANFTIDERYCEEKHPFTMHFDGFHSTSNGIGYFNNQTMYSQNGTYCVYEMLGGDFYKQVELAHKPVTVGALKNKQVPLSDVYVNNTCSTKIVQLDLIKSSNSCGEAPYGHTGSVWDFVIGYKMPGITCTVTPSPTPTLTHPSGGSLE